jgi:basic membrane protein A and related proteins
MRVALCAAAAVLVALTGASAFGRTSATVRVAYVTDAGSVSDGSFGENTYRGFVAAVRHLPVQARVVLVAPNQSWGSELALVAREGYDLIVVGPYIDPRATRAVALKFPRSTFLTSNIDTSLVPRLPRNMAIYTLRLDEAAFLAGYLAALVDDQRAGRHVVSSVGGPPIPQVRDPIVGFEAGAKRADPHITTLHSHVKDTLNPAHCRPIALEQIAEGSRAVFDVAGPCGIGALFAARDRGVWGIGINIDMSGLGSFILTSVLRREEPLFNLMLRAYLHGSLRRGLVTSVGLRDGVVGLGRINSRVPKSIVAKVVRLRAQIVAGAVTVPSAK